MQSTTQLQTTTTTRAENYVPKWIFCLQLNDGRYVIGHANNAARRISNINSGCNPAVKSLSVNRIIGIKEQNEERTLAGVVAKFCDKYVANRVITV